MLLQESIVNDKIQSVLSRVEEFKHQLDHVSAKNCLITCVWHVYSYNSFTWVEEAFYIIYWSGKLGKHSKITIMIIG